MGINMNDAFPSKWLKASDIEGDMRVSIASVTMEDVGDDDRKPVVWFNEYDKGMVLNKTNANNVSALYGADSDNWIGKPMTLATAMVDFQGKSMRALRLYAPNTRTGHNTTRKPAYQSGLPAEQRQQSGDPRGNVPPPQSSADYAVMDDDVPFAPEFRG